MFLELDGPSEYPVEADAVKLQRIAQNLLLNALKYTRQGGVAVRWGDSRKNDPERWMLTIEDTGPGIDAGPGAPLAGALQEATKEARQVEITGESEAQRDASRSPRRRRAVRTSAPSTRSAVKASGSRSSNV